MNKVTLSNEYQVVIPKEVREKIGLKAGVSLEIITYSNRIELVPMSLRGAELRSILSAALVQTEARSQGNLLYCLV